jgi:hypothetical protein
MGQDEQGRIDAGALNRRHQFRVSFLDEYVFTRKLKDKEKRAARKQRKALEKIQAEANRANSERFMQGFLGNLRIEPLEKGITPEGDG